MGFSVGSFGVAVDRGVTQYVQRFQQQGDALALCQLAGVSEKRQGRIAIGRKLDGQGAHGAYNLAVCDLLRPVAVAAGDIGQVQPCGGHSRLKSASE